MNGTLALRGRFFEIDALWEDERWALLESSEPVGFTRNDFEEAFVAFVDEQRMRERDEVAADLRKALGQGRHPHPHAR